MFMCKYICSAATVFTLYSTFFFVQFTESLLHRHFVVDELSLI